jgi:DNA-binding NarL/FixJ family response regulator
LKTLIVEDNATFRKAFSDVLKDLFPAMRIEEAANAKEALDKARGFAPDLIFMDIRLGQQNGLELTKKIRQDDSKATIVVLTDYNLPEYREAAFQCGADDFVVKGSLNLPAVKALIQSISSDKNLGIKAGRWSR